MLGMLHRTVASMTTGDALSIRFVSLITISKVSYKNHAGKPLNNVEQFPDFLCTVFILLSLIMEFLIDAKE